MFHGHVVWLHQTNLLLAWYLPNFHSSELHRRLAQGEMPCDGALAHADGCDGGTCGADETFIRQ